MDISIDTVMDNDKLLPSAADKNYGRLIRTFLEFSSVPPTEPISLKELIK